MVALMWCAQSQCWGESPLNTPVHCLPPGASEDAPSTLWHDHSLDATLEHKRVLPLPFTAPAGL